jgi:membrane-associated protease RseP (regulator of RpoE activity)
MFYEMMALPDLSRIGSILEMLIFISVLIIAHEMGHFWVARRCGIKVERFGFGLPFGPTLWSKKIGDVEYCIHACLFGGYVAFPDDDPENPLPPDSPERFENQPIGARLAVMLAGVTVNAILGWALMFFVFMNWGYPTGEVEKKVLIDGVVSQSAPAALAGVQKGDEIKQVNNVTIAGKDYLAMMNQVKSILEANSSHTIPMAVQRHGRLATLQVTPDATGKLGMQLGAIPKYQAIANSAEGAAKTTSFLGDVIQKQFEAFGKLFTGQMPLKELAGPIRIVDQGATMIHQNGIQTGLMLTAIISVILAVMNLLPIPALDGGHVFFLLIEAMKGSPVNQDFREKVTQFGFLGMLALIAFILVNDINNTFINPVK